RFSSTVISGTSPRSWWTNERPSTCGSLGSSGSATGLPAISSEAPSSGEWKPAGILMNVDLPEPFWPSKPRTSPGRMSGSKRRGPVRPETVFETFRAERTVCWAGALIAGAGRPDARVRPAGRPSRLLLDAPELLVRGDVVGVPVPRRLLRLQVDGVDVARVEEPVLDPDVGKRLHSCSHAQCLVCERPALQEVRSARLGDDDVVVLERLHHRRRCVERDDLHLPLGAGRVDAGQREDDHAVEVRDDVLDV